jgi:hypothetical protein
MAIDRTGFEWLFLHARLLPDLQLALMAQELAASPPGPLDPAHAAAFADTQPSEDALREAPGADVDWFGVGDLSEAELAQLREAAERELAAFEASPPPALAPVHAGAADDAPIDFVHELARAYAQRDAVASVAAKAFERIDRVRLDGLLSAVAEAGPALTAALSADGLNYWLQRMQDGDAALTALMDHVLDAGDWH